MLYERLDLPTPDGGSFVLEAYIPEVTEQIDPDIQRSAVVICPGGGYHFTSHREGEPIALTFAAKGFAAFICWYRTDEKRFPQHVQELALAVHTVRSHAADWHVHPDRIAVLGFSAGGHLAGSLGVLWPREDLWRPLGLTPAQVRPNAQVLCYPVITAGPKAHRGSFVNLTGSEDLALHQPYSLETLVSAQTPPAFIWHTWEDELVPVENALLMASAMRAHSVLTELHIFPHGGHGAALANHITGGLRYGHTDLPECAAWPDLAARFLRDVLNN